MLTMPSFTFSISPTGVTQMHDALSCLAKFDENVSLEANAEELRISSLNTSKTAYASFIFTGATFFDKYNFSPASQRSSKTWACKLQNRALLSVLKKRALNDRDRDKGTSIERCDFELLTRPDQTQCRLVFRLFCPLSVVKTFRLTYESAEVLHATFDKHGSWNTWAISSKTLRDVVEYFGPKTDHVDWSMESRKVTFTSYTEKIQVGKEIIKQPTHTSVQLDEQDFDECRIEEELHISIPVKDFRSIVAHSETMRATVKTSYSHGHRPTQITYGAGGLTAEFTLMTRGTSTAVSDHSRSDTQVRGLSVRPTSQLASQSDTREASGITTLPAESTRAVERPSMRGESPSLAHTASRRTTSRTKSAYEGMNSVTSGPQPSVPSRLQPSTSTDSQAPPASINPDSLFFPAPEDDDSHWDPPNFDNEREYGAVTWGYAEDDDQPWAEELPTPRDPRALASGRLADGSAMTSYRSAVENHPVTDSDASTQHSNKERFGGEFDIAPTQGRLSQVRGIFD